jgi:hypothetical protein
MIFLVEKKILIHLDEYGRNKIILIINRQFYKY